ncbi:MAG: sigma-70 family RNA polymerase sigma factor [Actinomycetota bacterium]
MKPNRPGGGAESEVPLHALQAAPLGDLQDRRDRDAIERTADGDERAFVETYRRYAPAALGLARRVIGDAGLAEEVVQEVFVSVWRRSGSYDQARGTVRSWLLAQVHHRAVDVIRRESAQRRRATEQTEAVAADGIDDVVEEAWLATRRTEVRTALTALPQELRRVLEHQYLDGMTQVQVAAHLGIPLGTVKSRTVGAMRRMRGMLGGSIEGGATQERGS